MIGEHNNFNDLFEYLYALACCMPWTRPAATVPCAAESSVMVDSILVGVCFIYFEAHCHPRMHVT